MLGIIAVLVILGYLRYSHLAKKGMTFVEICKNFIPIGAIVGKNKGKRQDVGQDEPAPKPEVKNGYLQKPTVGVAAAQAYRPVRSNVAAANNQQKQETSSEPAPSQAPVQAPRRPARQATAASVDPELAEMERRQKIMEQELNQLFSNKNKFLEDDPPKT